MSTQARLLSATFSTWSLATCLLASCVSEPASEPLPQGDLTQFSASVQPVLAARCADPTCHGRDDRPLAVYATRRFRMDPDRVFLEEPIDAEETAANARSVASFMIDSGADDCLVLRKPLAETEGGAHHLGGEIFSTRDDREYRALRAWLESLVRSGGGR